MPSCWLADEWVSLLSFGRSAKLLEQPVKEIQLLGSHERIKWTQGDDTLVITPPKTKTSDIAIVFKITPKA